MTAPVSPSQPSRALLPCPICGAEAKIERPGTARQSCIIACEGCGCRLETGEVWSMGERWNERSTTAHASLRARVEVLEKALQSVADFMRKDVQSGDSALWTPEYEELHDKVIVALHRAALNTGEGE